jgi:hypothetical protein
MVTAVIEARVGFAGARRALGVSGAISGPLTKEVQR